MPGEFKENIYYRRKSNPGDTTIEGRASNGITLDNTGNIFLYSSILFINLFIIYLSMSYFNLE